MSRPNLNPHLNGGQELQKLEAEAIGHVAKVGQREAVRATSGPGTGMFEGLFPRLQAEGRQVKMTVGQIRIGKAEDSVPLVGR